jgi:hypothetical protein
VLVLRMVEERFHRDAEDRPIREGRTPPEMLREGEIEYRRCPYSGSRSMHANPMNVSALRQISAHWDEVVDALTFLRGAYKEARSGYRADLMDIWRVSQLGSALPWFFILHQRTTCPAYAAALSKATLGVGIWSARLLVTTLAEGHAPSRYTAQMILETSEATGTLIADTEVCAASDRMMLKFYEPVVDETPFTGAGEAAHLPRVRDEVVRFGAHYLAFKQWLWMYWLARRFLFEDVASVIGRRAELEELLDPEAEPPDFFLVQPERIAELPLAQRAHWFRGLAALVEPFAPDRSDAPYREHAARIAAVMGEQPARLDELALEVQRVTGSTPEASRRIARAVGTYAALDALLGDVLATVEAGFRGDPTPAIDASVRDRVLGRPPRALFAAFAPELFAKIARR